jgi:hypothetical protein
VDAVFFILFASGVEQSWNRYAATLNDSVDGDKPRKSNSAAKNENYGATRSDKDGSATRRNTPEGEIGKDERYDAYIIQDRFRGGYVNKAYLQEKN